MCPMVEDVLLRKVLTYCETMRFVEWGRGTSFEIRILRFFVDGVENENNMARSFMRDR